MKIKFLNRNISFLGCLCWLSFLSGTTTPFTAHAAAELSCPASLQINQTFDNGAQWAMCWESKQRENLVLSEAQYSTPEGNTYKVFGSLRLSQLHVAYDDSNVTYYDVTQFGLGAGYISPLDELDCPNGELIEIASKQGLCKSLSAGNDSYHTANEHRASQSLSLFSVSQVGSYAYLITWKFFADGSVQPSVGAAGALQRSADLNHNDDTTHSHSADHDDATQYGRELSGSPDKIWLSHTHNYYWRIDFDLGSNANDDTVSEVNYSTDESGRTARSVQSFTTETARAVAPDSHRSWIISADQTDPMLAPGYLIEPINYGHKLDRRLVEPFTEFDFFVTQQKSCERFVTQNALYNPDCKENLLQFVDDESLLNEDIVVWHRVSFHHVPRNEDRVNMHSHWDGFVMQARNFSSTTPGHSGNADDYTLASAAFTNDDSTAPSNEVESAATNTDVTIGKSGIGKLDLTLVLILLAYTYLIFLFKRRTRR